MENNTATVSLVKGQNIDLTKGNPGLKVAHVGLGWDVNQGNGAAFDLDAFCFILNAQKKWGMFAYLGGKVTVAPNLKNGKSVIKPKVINHPFVLLETASTTIMKLMGK